MTIDTDELARQENLDPVPYDDDEIKEPIVPVPETGQVPHNQDLAQLDPDLKAIEEDVTYPKNYSYKCLRQTNRLAVALAYAANSF